MPAEVHTCGGGRPLLTAWALEPGHVGGSPGRCLGQLSSLLTQRQLTSSVTAPEQPGACVWARLLASEPWTHPLHSQTWVPDTQQPLHGLLGISGVLTPAQQALR